MNKNELDGGGVAAKKQEGTIALPSYQEPRAALIGKIDWLLSMLLEVIRCYSTATKPEEVPDRNRNYPDKAIVEV